MKLITCIQYIEQYPSENAARDGLAFLETQVDYLGGRALPPTAVNPIWRTQTFFEDTPEAEADLPLPDGCRRVKAIAGRCGLPV